MIMYFLILISSMIFTFVILFIMLRAIYLTWLENKNQAGKNYYVKNINNNSNNNLENNSGDINIGDNNFYKQEVKNADNQE